MFYNSKRKLLIILIIFLIILLICLIFLSTFEFTKNNSNSVTTLEVACYGNKTQQQKCSELLSYYKSQHNDIKINIKTYDKKSYWSYLSLALSSGIMPDVFLLPDDMYDEFIYLDVLADISGIVDSYNITDNNYEIMKPVNKDNKYFGIPIGISAKAFIVNLDILDRMNFKLPNKITWNNLIEFGKDFKPVLDNRGYTLSYPINDIGIQLDTFIYYLKQNNMSLVNENGDIGFEQSDVYDYIQIYADYRDKGVIPPISVSAKEFKVDPELSFMVTRAMAIDYINIHQVGNYQQYSRDQFDIILDKDKSLNQMTGTYISVYKNTKSKEAAYDLVNFWFNDYEANKIWSSPYGKIINNSLHQKIYPLFSKEQILHDNITDELLKSGVEFGTDFIGKSTMEVYFKDIYIDIAFNVIDISQGSELIYNRMKSILIKPS